MKLIAAAVLGAGLLLAGPALAQDKDKDMGGMAMGDKPAAEHHMASRHVTYKRNYKTDQEEHQATEDLNRQYRGVPSDQH